MSVFLPPAPVAQLGIPLVLDERLAEGEMLMLGPDLGPYALGGPQVIVLGIGPIDWRTWCRREARRIVRTGLADVLDWLGEPQWRPARTSAEILAELREAS